MLKAITLISNCNRVFHDFVGVYSSGQQKITAFSGIRKLLSL